MTRDELIDQLTSAKLDPSHLAEQSDELRRLCDSVGGESPLVGILGDLVWDLEFFSPSASARAEEPTLFGEARALELLEEAIEALRHLLIDS